MAKEKLKEGDIIYCPNSHRSEHMMGITNFEIGVFGKYINGKIYFFSPIIIQEVYELGSKIVLKRINETGWLSSAFFRSANQQLAKRIWKGILKKYNEGKNVSVKNAIFKLIEMR